MLCHVDTAVHQCHVHQLAQPTAVCHLHHHPHHHRWSTTSHTSTTTPSTTKLHKPQPCPLHQCQLHHQLLSKANNTSGNTSHLHHVPHHAHQLQLPCQSQCPQHQLHVPQPVWPPQPQYAHLHAQSLAARSDPVKFNWSRFWCEQKYRDKIFIKLKILPRAVYFFAISKFRDAWKKQDDV